MNNTKEKKKRKGKCWSQTQRCRLSWCQERDEYDSEALDQLDSLLEEPSLHQLEDQSLVAVQAECCVELVAGSFQELLQRGGVPGLEAAVQVDPLSREVSILSCRVS